MDSPPKPNALKRLSSIQFDRLNQLIGFLQAHPNIAIAFNLGLIGFEGVKNTVKKWLKRTIVSPGDRELVLDSIDPLYGEWLARHCPRKADLEKLNETVALFRDRPLISIIVPLVNPSEEFLKQAIESVQAQIYPNWELCIAGDRSIEVNIKSILKEYAEKDTRIQLNLDLDRDNVAQLSNSALTLATGQFVTRCYSDDRLAPDALYEVALWLQRDPDADIIYSDEDRINEFGQRSQPHFKPDWCPDSLLSRMYVGQLGVYRRSLVDRMGGFRVGYEGDRDYDLVLRLSEQTDRIHHIPKVLYHRRTIAKPSPQTHVEKKVLTETLQRRSLFGNVIPTQTGCWQIRYHIQTYRRVSIIIPTRDRAAILDTCLTSIFEKTDYPDYEVLVVDNGSVEDRFFQVIEKWKQKQGDRFRVERLDIPFNYSKLNNDGVARTGGDYLLFLNNDTEVLHSDWITAMVEQAQRPSVGAVGALLLYPDNTIQHAGVVVGIGRAAGHSHKHYASNAPGYFNQIQTTNNYSAVTAACLMCRRDAFEEVNGFEEELAVNFNDVDFCLKLRDRGYQNLYLPHVVLYHYESKSRDRDPQRDAQLATDTAYLQRKWKRYLDRDPCYSPHLTHLREDYSLNLED